MGHSIPSCSLQKAVATCERYEIALNEIALNEPEYINLKLLHDGEKPIDYRYMVKYTHTIDRVHDFT